MQFWVEPTYYIELSVCVCGVCVGAWVCVRERDGGIVEQIIELQTRKK